MTAITFDTLAYVKTLRDAGIEERQAEAQATALAPAPGQSGARLTPTPDAVVDSNRARLPTADREAITNEQR